MTHCEIGMAILLSGVFTASLFFIIATFLIPDEKPKKKKILNTRKRERQIT